MRRKLSIWLCTVLLTGCLTACGVEYAGVSEKDAVSGSSVSGSAVSGSATEERKETEEKSEPRKYTFCNDRNLYYYTDVNEMIERSMEDGSERKIEVKNMVVLRKELDSSGKLCLEKKLSKCLENPEENQQVFSKFVSRGTSEYFYRSRGLCMCMTEDICLMYVENTEKKRNMWACYDFTTGKFRYITKKDTEWYLMYYDRYNTFHTGILHEDPLDFDQYQYMKVISVLPNNYDS